MRQTAIVGITAIVTAIVTILGSNVMSGSVPRHQAATAASAPVSAMQMMQNARDLPVQEYDAI